MRNGAFEAACAQKTSLAIPDRPEDRRCLRGLCRLPGHRSQLGSDSMGRLGGLRRLRIARLHHRLDHYARGEAPADQPCPFAGGYTATCGGKLANLIRGVPTTRATCRPEGGLCFENRRAGVSPAGARASCPCAGAGRSRDRGRLARGGGGIPSLHSGQALPARGGGTPALQPSADRHERLLSKRDASPYKLSYTNGTHNAGPFVRPRTVIMPIVTPRPTSPPFPGIGLAWCSALR